MNGDSLVTVRPTGGAVDRRETYRNTLQYALAIAGSELTLSVRLKVTVSKLRIWLDGIEEVPVTAFLDAVDMVSAATPAEIAKSRAAIFKIDK